jgi:GNAT superfamily N-acetyltransferase
MATEAVPAGSRLDDVTFRPATVADLTTCATIWRIATNDYTGRLNQPEIPDDLAAVIRLYSHLRATDPDGFVVAERVDGSGAARIVAFASAVRRESFWFLSMLFVRPEMQGGGFGRALLDRVLPPPGSAVLATCTDSVQPISNGLYASLGMIPRMPLIRLVGLPDRPGVFAPLPDGVRAVSFDAAGDVDAAVDAIDREVVGFAHRQDHDLVRREERRGFLYLDPDDRPVGYGHASEAGRVGPVAALDPALLDPILGHVVTTVRPRGAFGIWMPGSATTAMTSFLRARFRIEGFPCLVCWDRPLIDFSRYVPISPGLL